MTLTKASEFAFSATPIRKGSSVPTMEFTTKLGCSLACTFCPQIKLVKNYPRAAERMLSLENFKMVVSKLPPYVRLDFSGMSEPWLNPVATEMVSHSYEAGRDVAVYTTLEGLSSGDATHLLNTFQSKISPATPWVVHLPDDEDNMPGWKSSNSYSETLEAVLKFKVDHPDVSVRFMTMSSTGAVHPSLRGLFDEQLSQFVGISRAENVNREKFDDNELIPAVRHTSPILCKSTPFFDHNGILPNGDVVLCCMDYSIQNVIGNLFTQSYADLFSGPTMQKTRQKSMEYGFDPDFICKQCENAACLERTMDSTWKLSTSAYWADPGGSKQEALSARAHQQYEARAREKVERDLAEANVKLSNALAAHLLV